MGSCRRKNEKVKGIVVLTGNPSNSGVSRVLDGLNRVVDGLIRVVDVVDRVFEGAIESLGAKVSLQLISSTKRASSWERQGKVGKKAYLAKRTNKMESSCGENFVSIEVNFEWDKEFGIPGAFFIRNRHVTPFFLRSLTLENVPDLGRIHFDCNS